jgi:type I restriction enzyme S subunit
MKEDWQTRKIGEVCDLMTGGTPPRSKAEYFGGEVKWLVSGDIHQGEIFDCKGRITEAGMQASNAKQLPLNSVMIALNGQGKTRGTVALLRTQATCNQSLVSIYPKEPGKLLPEFLYANLHGRYQEIRQMTGDSGNDRRGLNMGLIRQMEIPLAPVGEQQRIVGILDKAFEGIATAKANAEKNLQNARAIFESHLQSVFISRGEGWVERPLAEISQVFGRGKSKHRPRNEPKLYGGKYPFIQTGDISNANHRIASYAQTYSELGLAQSKLWPKGTICIAIVGATVGETAILDFDACFPDSVIGIVVNDQLADCDYVEYLLQSFKAVLKEKGKGTARDNINLGTFESQKFPFPKLHIQKKIASTLNDLDQETKRLAVIYERKLVVMEALKESLLHQAFTGNL